MGQVFDHLELYEKDYFGLQYIQQPGDVVVRLLIYVNVLKSKTSLTLSDGWIRINPYGNNGTVRKAIQIHRFYLELR